VVAKNNEGKGKVKKNVQKWVANGWEEPSFLPDGGILSLFGESTKTPIPLGIILHNTPPYEKISLPCSSSFHSEEKHFLTV
jgi:hypothetical protein